MIDEAMVSRWREALERCADDPCRKWSVGTCNDAGHGEYKDGQWVPEPGRSRNDKHGRDCGPCTARRALGIA